MTDVQQFLKDLDGKLRTARALTHSYYVGEEALKVVGFVLLVGSG